MAKNPIHSFPVYITIVDINSEYFTFFIFPKRTIYVNLRPQLNQNTTNTFVSSIHHNCGYGGGHTFKLCTIFPHTLELLLAFHYDWENETILPGTLRHFKRYQTCIVTFCTYYIAWILGDEGRGENGDCSRSLVRTVSTGCETPQCAASWMLLLYARDSSR